MRFFGFSGVPVSSEGGWGEAALHVGAGGAHVSGSGGCCWGGTSTLSLGSGRMEWSLTQAAPRFTQKIPPALGRAAETQQGGIQTLRSAPTSLCARAASLHVHGDVSEETEVLKAIKSPTCPLTACHAAARFNWCKNLFACFVSAVSEKQTALLQGVQIPSNESGRVREMRFGGVIRSKKETALKIGFLAPTGGEIKP